MLPGFGLGGHLPSPLPGAGILGSEAPEAGQELLRGLSQGCRAFGSTPSTYSAYSVGHSQGALEALSLLSMLETRTESLAQQTVPAGNLRPPGTGTMGTMTGTGWVTPGGAGLNYLAPLGPYSSPIGSVASSSSNWSMGSLAAQSSDVFEMQSRAGHTSTGTSPSETRSPPGWDGSPFDRRMYTPAPPAAPSGGSAPPKPGRYWSKDEHNRFLIGLQRFGCDHCAISEVVGTRTAKQVRSHSQKFFLKLHEHVRMGGGLGGALPDMSRRKKRPLAVQEAISAALRNGASAAAPANWNMQVHGVAAGTNLPKMQDW